MTQPHLVEVAVTDVRIGDAIAKHEGDPVQLVTFCVTTNRRCILFFGPAVRKVALDAKVWKQVMA